MRWRISRVRADSNAVGPADVVVLNRVVCCSPDGVELARSAARLTRRTLVLSFPRDAFWLRIGTGVMNAVFGVMGRSYRIFLHPRELLVAAAGAEGLTLDDEGGTFAWQYMGLRRRT